VPDSCALQNKALPKLISDVEEMEVQCQNLRDELGSDMMSQLNRNEQEEGMWFHSVSFSRLS
jgi:rhamnogalacturonyl hydrolase YesR